MRETRILLFKIVRVEWSSCKIRNVYRSERVGKNNICKGKRTPNGNATNTRRNYMTKKRKGLNNDKRFLLYHQQLTAGEGTM